jgi:tetratricopeptide (TPR) repeat protein
LRTGPYSRVEVSLPGETEVRTYEDTAFTFAPPEDDNHVWLDLLRGLIHIMSRDPRALRVTTPYADAGLEGTEFLERLDGEELDLSVYEGTVRLDSGTGTLEVQHRNRATVRAGVLGQSEGNERERDDLLWSLHYPRVLDGALPGPDAAVPTGADRAAFFAARAQSQLSVGRIGETRADVAAALAIAPAYPDALAVTAMIALAAGELDEARSQLDKALGVDPYSAAALTALSYLLEQENERRRAFEVIRRAAEHHPENAVVQARFAQVGLGVDAVGEALLAADRAMALDPALALPHTVRGFAALRSGDIESSRSEFSEALRLDSAAGLPRVGLALVSERVGEFVEARDQIEIATILEANDSVVRAYLGKAYNDEERNDFAGRQFDRSQRLDTSDPTGPLYVARLQFDENLPVAALHDLRAAGIANGNEPAFRSRLRLDEDLVTRSAGVGRIYRDAGLVELAMQTGWRKIVKDPTDFSGYRLLADVASEIPRTQITRVNNAYQARQFQPQHVVPDPPQMAEANLFIRDSVGPSPLAHAEARSGFVRNGLVYQTSAVTGSNGLLGDHFVLSSVGDKVSADFGQYHFESNGFRSNNDIEHDVLSLFVQGRPSSETSLQMDLRSTRTVKGDLQLRFMADDFNPLVRQRETMDSVRVGASHRLGPWSTIVSTLLLERADDAVVIPSALSAHISTDTGIAETVLVHERPKWSYVGGVRLLRSNVLQKTTSSVALPDPPNALEQSSSINDTNRHLQTYFYANGQITDSVLLTVGASLENLHGEVVDVKQHNAKLGLAFRPTPQTELRVALFQTLSGPIVSKQLIHPSLEPMQVTGFGQYFYGAEGESAKNYALGLNHELTANLRLGAEHMERRIDVPFTVVMLPSTDYVVDYLDVREVTDSAYLYWTPDTRVALKFGWQDEDFDYHGMTSPYGFSRLRTKRLPVEATVFIGDALSLRFKGTHVRQGGVFGFYLPTPGRAPGEDQFRIFDAAVGYRLPKRHGSVELGIRNLLDEAFRFQDTDPENPRVFPDRFASLRVLLNF